MPWNPCTCCRVQWINWPPRNWLLGVWVLFHGENILVDSELFSVFLVSLMTVHDYDAFRDCHDYAQLCWVWTCHSCMFYRVSFVIDPTWPCFLPVSVFFYGGFVWVNCLYSVVNIFLVQIFDHCGEVLDDKICDNLRSSSASLLSTSMKVREPSCYLQQCSVAVLFVNTEFLPSKLWRYY